MTADRRDRSLIPALQAAFARIAGWSFDYRWVVLGLFAAFVGVTAHLASRVLTSSGIQSYFEDTDPHLIAYEKYREDFGSDEVSYILYDAPGYEHGPWNLEVMRKIATLTTALEDEVPFVYQVRSLVNAELLIGVEDGLEIHEIADDFPESQEAMLVARERVMSKPMLVGGLVSGDSMHAAIIVEMDASSTDPIEDLRLDPEGGDGIDNIFPTATEAVISSILERPEYAGIRFYHGGDVALDSAYYRVIWDEGRILALISMLVIGGILLASYRSVIGTLAPLAVVQLTIMACIAFIYLVGWKLDLGFSRTPTLLTAIGVAHSVHIISEFRSRYAALRDRRAALVESVALVGVPCLMTSITTAIGFAAIGFSPIKSLSHAGIYSAVGVVGAFVLSFTLLMALLVMSRRELAGLAGATCAVGAFLALRSFGILEASLAALVAGSLGIALITRLAAHEREPARVVSHSPRVDRSLTGIADFSIRFRKPILIGFAALFALCFLGIPRIVVDTNWMETFSYAMPIKAITERIDGEMGGSSRTVFVFDSGESDGIMEPAVLREMERIQTIGAGHHAVRKSYSLVDILKDLNQAFHGGDPAYHVIPDSRELVAQYLLLYESSGGDEAEEYVTPDYQRASVEVRMALGPSSWASSLINEVNSELQVEPLESTEVMVTGIGSLYDRLMDYIVWTQITSFVLAFGAIALILIGLFSSGSTGLIAMVPNLTPVALVLGIMGWSGIYLDYSKVMIAAVAMGIAVDDTIHMMTRYRHEFSRCGDYTEALRRAMLGVGRPLMITSAALVGGFLVLTFSVLNSEVSMGILLATTIITALIADFLLMPALILTFHPFGPESAGQAEHLSDAA